MRFLALVSLLLASIPCAQSSSDRREPVPVSKTPSEKPSPEVEEFVLRLGTGLPEGVALDEVRVQLLSWWPENDPLVALDYRADPLNGVLGELHVVDGLLEARFRFEEKPNLTEDGLLLQVWTEDEAWWACAPLDVERGESRIAWQPCGRLEVALKENTADSEDFVIRLCRTGNAPALVFVDRPCSNAPAEIGPLPVGEYVVLSENVREQLASDVVTVSVLPGRIAQVHAVPKPYAKGSLAGSVQTLSGERPPHFIVKLIGTTAPYRCLWLEPISGWICGTGYLPIPWRPVRWNEELLEAPGVPAGTYWVQQGEWLEEDLPLSFSTQRLVIPGEPLQVTVLDDERAPGLRMHLFDADSGESLDTGEAPARISVLRAGCPLAFERPVRSGQVFAGAELGLLAFEWQLELDGYATACGDASAFAAPDASGRRDARVKLRRGWGKRLWVEHAGGRPAAQLAVLIDGMESGRTNRDGWCDLWAPAAPGRVEVLLPSGTSVPVELRPGAAPLRADGRLRITLPD